MEPKVFFLIMGSPLSKMLDWDSVESEFDLQYPYYVLLQKDPSSSV